MADYSNARINVSLFQQRAEDRKSEKSPHATGYMEIAVEDLNEFFSLAVALEPVENWKNQKVIKLRTAAWHKVTRDGRKFDSVSVSPDRAAEFKPDDETITHATEVVDNVPKDLSRAL